MVRACTPKCRVSARRRGRPSRHEKLVGSVTYNKKIKPGFTVPKTRHDPIRFHLSPVCLNVSYVLGMKPATKFKIPFPTKYKDMGRG
jgi:hypothetical protein